MRKIWMLALLAPWATDARSPRLPANYVAGNLITLDDNGAWSWFMDERAIVYDNKLIVGSVRAVGDYKNDRAPDWGNVEVSVYDLASGATGHTVLHRHLEQDDHASPAFLALPDGRVLAFYTQHGVERRIYYAFSAPHNPLVWGPTATFDTPGDSAAPLRGNNVTYSNLFQFSSGRIYNFFRGVGLEPNYMYSDDTGHTWHYGGRIAHGTKGGYTPYLKYAFDGVNTIHFVMTENHPRNYDNSLYHAFIRDGTIYLSDGTRRGKLSETTETDLNAWDFTKVFQGDPDNVAWMSDIELDSAQRPYVVFSVQKDGRGLPRGQGGFDHRFDYARWDGAQWHVHEMAYAGTRLYAGEDDYTGLASLDPNDPDVVYISTDADPVTGAPLLSSTDGLRHHELFRGTTRDFGSTWRWEPLTANSTMDNLRPLVPKWTDGRTALVWMRGTYRNNHGEWTTAVVAMILTKPGP